MKPINIFNTGMFGAAMWLVGFLTAIYFDVRNPIESNYPIIEHSSYELTEQGDTIYLYERKDIER